MGGRGWHSMLAWLGVSRGESAARGPDSTDEPLRAEFDDQTTRDKLHGMFQHHDAVALGRIYVLNLDDLVLSGNQPTDSKLQQLKDTAGAVIKEYLTKGEAYAIDDKGHITLYMPRLRRDAGELKLRTIADAIAARVRVTQSAAPNSDARSPGGLKTRTSFQRISRRGFHRKPSKPTKPPEDAEHRDQHRPEDWYCEDHLILQALRQAQAGQRAMREMAAKYEDRPMATPDKQPSPWSAIVDEFAREQPDITIAEHPIWRVKREFLTASALRIARGAGAVATEIPESELAELSLAQRSELDSYAVAASLVRAENTAAGNTPSLYIVPVSFRCVESDPHRLKILAMLQAAPPPVQKLLVIELVDVPTGATAQRLRPVTDRLRRLCRSLMVRLPLVAQDFAIWRNLGVGTAGVDLADSNLSESELFAGLEHFVATAEKARLTCYATGLPSRSLAIAALGAGFAYVGGSTLDAAAPQTGGPVRFSLADLYRSSPPNGDSLMREIAGSNSPGIASGD